MFVYVCLFMILQHLTLIFNFNSDDDDARDDVARDDDARR